MKTVLIVILLLIVAVVAYFFVLGVLSKSGSPPGLKNGQLAQCGNKPNCVCSEQAGQSDAFIAPVYLYEGNAEPLAAMRQVIISQGGVVQQQSGDYLAATFTSRLFGFVDDLEVRWDREQQVLHLRSASRVGYSDLGANRKRMEQLKQVYLAETAPD